MCSRVCAFSATIGSTSLISAYVPVAFMGVEPGLGIRDSGFGTPAARTHADAGAAKARAFPFPNPASRFPASPIHLAEHDVVGADHRDDVRQHVSAHDRVD